MHTNMNICLPIFHYRLHVTSEVCIMICSSCFIETTLLYNGIKFFQATAVQIHHKDVTLLKLKINLLITWKIVVSGFGFCLVSTTWIESEVGLLLVLLHLVDSFELFIR